MTVNKQKPLNERIFKGAKIIRILDRTDLIIDTLETQIQVNGEVGNELSIKYLEGRIQGIQDVLNLICDEFGIEKG